MSKSYEIKDGSKLPEGLLLDETSGLITGTPNRAYVDGMDSQLLICGKNGAKAEFTLTFTIAKGTYTLADYSEVTVELESTLGDITLEDGYTWDVSVDQTLPLTTLGLTNYNAVYHDLECGDQYNDQNVSIPVKVVCTKADAVCDLIDAIGTVAYI